MACTLNCADCNLHDIPIDESHNFRNANSNRYDAIERLIKLNRGRGQAGERAELAGPELLLKPLKEVLSREGFESISDLPDGIHSGLRREKCFGLFFYFQASRKTVRRFSL